jgi:transcriptional regulator of acetoin/glycerol metabolism
VLDALEASKYSKTNAAKYLGISRVALWKKMKKLGIK